MRKILRKGEFWILIFLFSALAFIYRDVLLKNKIVFTSDFLATFYSPWATQKFIGYPNGIPHKPIGGNDQVRMFYPYRTFINESLAKGELPLWNPYNFSGSPIIANFQSAVFYPLNIIYFFLPQITAWSILVVIQPLLSTLFMYLYLRQFISQKLASFFGAFAFGFSGFILVWSQENAVVGQATLWFPAILYAVEKFVNSFKLKHFLLLTVSLSVSILAGFMQVSFYIFIASLLYGVFRINQINSGKKGRKLIYLFSSFLVSFLMCAVQLLPSIEAFFESARSASSAGEVFKSYLIPLKFYIKILAPDIFGNPATYNYWGQGFYHESILYLGIIPLVFAILSMISLRHNKYVRLFFGAGVISFILGVKSFFTEWFYRLPIPLVNTFLPSRIFFITSTSLAILGAFGFSHWLTNDTKSIRRTIRMIAILLASMLIFIAGYYYLSAITNNNNKIVESIAILIKPRPDISVANAVISIRNVILPLLMLFSIVLLTLLKNKLRILGTVLVLLTCLGQFYFLYKYAVVGNKEFLYPEHFIFSDIKANQNITDRFLSFGWPILGDVGLVKHVYSPDGIDPVFPNRYGQLIYAAKNYGAYTKDIPRIEVSLSEYHENKNIIDNFRRLKLISLLGVTRVYNYEKDYEDPKIIDSIFPPDMFMPLWKRNNWQAYKNKKAYPRVFLADRYIIETDPQKSLDLIFSQNTDLRKTVGLEEKPDNFSPAVNDTYDGKIADVLLQVYQPQRIHLQVNTDGDRILFLSDNYYPGWYAYVDNKLTKIYRADYTFRAIVIPQGKHTVTFMFKPLSFKIGAFISTVTILVLISVVFVRRFISYVKIEKTF